MANNLKNWTIKDSLFYPLGLFNNASRNKTVFVAWGCNTLFTYIFKKSGVTNLLKESFKILLQGTVVDIIATELNTLCLTTFGYVYYFSSCKSLKRLDFLEGVRCITAISGGFGVIRVNKHNRIVLETYNDFTEDLNAGRRRRQNYDISFDEENVLGSSWSNEKLGLHYIAISNENRSFLELVAKEPLPVKELFLFTINNSLFGLFGGKSARDTEFTIFLVHTLPSEIESVRFIEEKNLILIFMKCGVLEMIFYSNCSKSLSRAIHVIDADVISFTIADGGLFYSDGMRVIKCNLSYDATKDTIVVKKVDKCISGILAVTWVSTMRKLICLSENNIFYRLKFEDVQTDEENDDEFLELNDEKIKEIESHFSKFMSVMDEPDKIQKRIKDECQKQERLLVVGRKNMYRDVVEVNIAFCKSLPELEGIVIYPISEQVLTKNTYFALVNVKIKENPIFRTGQWKICFELINDKHLFKSLLINQRTIESPLVVILQCEKNETLIIPEIKVSLTACVKVGSDLMYVAIPAAVASVDIAKLFSTRLKTFIDPSRKTVDEKIALILEKNEECAIFSPTEFLTKLKTPLLISQDEIYETFGVSISCSSKCLESKFVVYLIGSAVSIEYFELENVIEIASSDPGALYYTKRQLANKIFSDLYKNDPLSLENDLKSLHKIKSALDGKYCTSSEANNFVMSLKKIYWNLRKDTITKL